jgi:hypothetical protein
MKGLKSTSYSSQNKIHDPLIKEYTTRYKNRQILNDQEGLLGEGIAVIWLEF